MNRQNLANLLIEHPTIATLEEACAIIGADIESITDEKFKKWCIKKINRQVCTLRVQLKDEFLASDDTKKHEMLYKLIASEEELKRLKGNDNKTQITNTNTTQPVIQIKSDDPDILDKLNDL